jgi:hypothetical protein
MAEPLTAEDTRTRAGNSLAELGIASENPGAWIGGPLATRGALLESIDPSTG